MAYLKMILKQIYLKMIFYNSHVDYKGRFLVGILKTEPSFVFEYFEVMIKDKRKIYQKYDEYVNRLRRVWRADDYLEKILPLINENDLLVITADHGCDPTVPGTDHTREKVPVLYYSKNIEPKNLGEDIGFDTIANRISDWLF